MTLIGELIERSECIEKFVELLESRLVGPFIHSTYKRSFVKWLEDEGYFDAPASAHHHGTNAGDLFRHSLMVAEILAGYTNKLGLEWLRPCSPWAVGLFHDLCKMDNYIPYNSENSSIPIEVDGVVKKWSWNNKQLITGHGDKSVMLLSRFTALTEEELLCIRYHMGAYNREDWDGFDLAMHKYPNVLYTHMADMYASKIMGI